MKFLNIAINEIKINFRDKKSMIMFIIWPIMLITVLGFSLNSAFNKIDLFQDTKIVYTMGENTKNKQAFEEFLDIIKKQGIEIYQENNTKIAKEKVQNKEYICYFNFHKEGNKIDFYKNDKYSSQASVVEVIANSFIKKYNTVVEVIKINPTLIKKDNINKYVEVESLENKKTPSSLEYYAVTMIVMIILYISLAAVNSFGNEYTRNTIIKLTSSPASKHEIFIGKVLGLIFVSIIQILLVFLFSKYALKVYWGKSEGIILLVLLSEIIMAIFVGISIIYLFKKQSVAESFLNGILPFITFLGGGYTPINFQESKVLGLIYDFNIFSKIKDAIFNSMFFNNNDLSYKIIIINLSIAFIFLSISSLNFSRREAI
ncbi:ABC transporter permease [Clostridium sporogenes]|uniref:ABC transporter permease n=1 Tax=Clostridium sporogenes TaxID=1509 RepID=UPI00223797D1|nr:ABC transporter permease [Clostridium sporogenes]MCW6109391.1 ABC transporter permease [Clostridium sporogenes]